MTYKEISLSDIDALSEMFLETYSARPWNTPLTLDIATAMLRQVLSDDHFFGFCAYQDEMVCGMIAGRIEQSYDGAIFRGTEFFVKNSLRGQGIGTQMLCELERRLKERGVREIMSHTLRVDELLGFYQKNGFEPCDYFVMLGKRF